MKTLFLSLFILLLFNVSSSYAQSKKAVLQVAGSCGMCQKKIEKAATSAGASYAAWSPESKLLTIKFNSKNTSTVKIEQAIAHAGYDTEHAKASEATYAQLDECCQYDRQGSTSSCCTEKKCVDSQCMKDGKCSKDMECCKETACVSKGCCKN